MVSDQPEFDPNNFEFDSNLNRQIKIEPEDQEDDENIFDQSTNNIEFNNFKKFKIKIENVKQENISEEIKVSDELKKYQCDICKKSLSSKKNLNLHIQSVHEKIKKFKCGICKKLLSTKTTLNSHILTIHKKIRAFQCEICEKTFGEIIWYQNDVLFSQE